MSKTNFDQYLDEQLEDPEFARRFEAAGAGWEIALKLAELRTKAGLSQGELARQLHTSQQQISRLESPGYEGHSLRMVRRVAEALGARVRIDFLPMDYSGQAPAQVAEPPAKYGKTPSV